MFAYWLAHSSVDWLWEFPALSGAGPAWPGRGDGGGARAGGGARGGRPRPRAGAPAAGLLARASRRRSPALPPSASPWSRLAVRARSCAAATEIAATNPDAAIRDLDRAASLNPLSPLPQKAAGIIEIRSGDSAAARRHLLEAFDRDPHDSGLFLYLGAIASEAGHQRKAIRLAAEAFRLAPTDDSAYNFLRRLRDRERITPRQMDRWIQVDVNYRVSPELGHSSSPSDVGATRAPPCRPRYKETCPFCVKSRLGTCLPQRAGDSFE